MQNNPGTTTRNTQNQPCPALEWTYVADAQKTKLIDMSEALKTEGVK